MTKVLALLLLLLCSHANAAIDVGKVGWSQRLGTSLPLQLQFRDEQNRAVALRDYFGSTPVVLAFIYFSCPELCPEVLRGTEEALQATGLTAGKDYRLLAVSIDPHDAPQQALHHKHMMLRNSAVASNASLLTTADEGAATLARTVGFHYVLDTEHQQFAHAAGLVVIDPEGEVSRYFFGIRYPPDELRSALVDAKSGRIAAFADRLLLVCYHFDATKGRYSLAVINILRVLGIVSLIVGGLFAWRAFRKPTIARGD